jgi:hypothetical protein
MSLWRDDEIIRGRSIIAGPATRLQLQLAKTKKKEASDYCTCRHAVVHAYVLELEGTLIDLAVSASLPACHHQNRPKFRGAEKRMGLL